MPKAKKRRSAERVDDTSAIPSPSLPYEIIQNILSYLPGDHSSQATLHACTLLSRAWYSATITRLYENPRITGPNYASFAKSVCPSINAHIVRNGLAELIKTLDLGALIHHGSKSLTARLLGRVKGNLEEFVAPQASFGINALAALSKCARLRYLNLSLVSEAFTPSELSHTLRKLLSLETLVFPRAGKERYEILFSSWPANLRECIVTGGLRHGVGILGTWTDRNRDNLYIFPKRQLHNLTHLTLGNCAHLRSVDIEDIIDMQYLPRLEYLEIKAPMDALEPIYSGLFSRSTFRHLRIPASYIYAQFRVRHDKAGATPYNLDTLELDYIDGNNNPLVNIDLIWDAVDEGRFENLRRVRLDRRLTYMKVWPSGDEAADDQNNFGDFNQYLKALAREDGAGARYTEDEAGIRIFNYG